MRYGLKEHTIKAIQSVFAKHSAVKKAILYGSRAKGNYRNGSDVDLTLVGEDLTLTELLAIENELDDLLLPYKIDLSLYHQIDNPDLLEHVERVGKVFWEQENDTGNWKEITIGQITAKIGSGATPRGGANSYKEEGISLIRSQNVLDLQFSVNGLAFIDDEQADRLKNVIVKEGDVLLNITGDSVARVCKVPNNILPARVNQHVAIIRADRKKTIPDYILYNLMCQKEELLIQSEIGATRKAITKGMIEKFEILLPPLPEQRAIASVLSSLDDKIDLLRRQNKTLEQMAEALFRQWFVEEAEEEWEEGVLGDFITTNDNTISKNYPFQEIEYLDTGSLTKGQWGNLQSFLLSEAPSRAKRLVKHNDILYSTVRPNQLHYGIVRNPIKNLVVSTGFCVITSQSISPYFVYYFLTNKAMTKYLHSIAEGSTSAYPSLKPKDIEALELSIPPLEILKKFHGFVDTAWKKIETNQTQIRTLTSLRDTLLPRLMSGEVRVR